MAKKKRTTQRPAKKSGRTDKKTVNKKVKVKPKPKPKPRTQPKKQQSKTLKNVIQKTPKKTDRKDSRKGQLTRTRKPIPKTNTKGTRKTKHVSSIKKPIRKKQKPQSVRRTTKINVGTRPQSPTDKRAVNTSILKGKNILAIKAGGKPENVAKKLQGLTDGKQFKYLLNKNKPVKGKPAKEPKAIVLIVTYVDGDGQTKTFSQITPSDFIVNAENVSDYINETMDELNSVVENLGATGSGSSSGVDKVKKTAIKFIY